MIPEHPLPPGDLHRNRLGEGFSKESLRTMEEYIADEFEGKPLQHEEFTKPLKRTRWVKWMFLKALLLLCSLLLLGGGIYGLAEFPDFTIGICYLSAIFFKGRYSLLAPGIVCIFFMIKFPNYSFVFCFISSMWLIWMVDTGSTDVADNRPQQTDKGATTAGNNTEMKSNMPIENHGRNASDESLEAIGGQVYVGASDKHLEATGGEEDVGASDERLEATSGQEDVEASDESLEATGGQEDTIVSDECFARATPEESRPVTDKRMNSPVTGTSVFCTNENLKLACLYEFRHESFVQNIIRVFSATNPSKLSHPDFRHLLHRHFDAVCFYTEDDKEMALTRLQQWKELIKLSDGEMLKIISMEDYCGFENLAHNNLEQWICVAESRCNFILVFVTDNFVNSPEYDFCYPLCSNSQTNEKWNIIPVFLSRSAKSQIQGDTKFSLSLLRNIDGVCLDDEDHFGYLERIFNEKLFLRKSREEMQCEELKRALSQ